jgi:hypothetical protein
LFAGRDMSLYAKLAAGAVLLLALIAAGWKIHHSIDKAGYDRAMGEVAAKAEAMRVMQQEGIDNVSSAFTDKATKQRTIVQSNAEKVDQYVQADFPPLPGTFRLWHDAAATGQALDDTGRADAPGVTLKNTQTTIAYNYAACLYDQQRLESLQAIVRTMNGS